MSDIIFLLDASGSMQDMKQEPVQALNEFIRHQKTLCPSARFSMYLFNTNVRQIYNEVPLQDIDNFTDYNPQELTSLYDCIDTAITNKIATGNYQNVVCVILTDGHDTSSRNVDLTEVKDRIKEMEEKHGWHFTYLAANQDAFTVGGSMNIRNCSVFHQNRPQHLSQMLRAVSADIYGFRERTEKTDS